MAKMLLLSLLGLASAAATLASEPRPQAPGIVLGPGMPSLAELNLTSAQLAAMPPPDEATRAKARALFARGDKGEQGRCGPVEAAYTNVREVIQCYHVIRLSGLVFLDSHLSRDVPVRHICYTVTNTTIVALTSAKDRAHTSIATDLALGLLWVIDHCTRSATDVAGQQAANGNGDILVHAMSFSNYIARGVVFP